MEICKTHRGHESRDAAAKNAEALGLGRGDKGFVGLLLLQIGNTVEPHAVGSGNIDK
jgi:hypothetical protein